MAGILLTIHIIVSVGLVVSILLQRSEGGLGGLGGGMSNVMAPEFDKVKELVPQLEVPENMVVPNSKIQNEPQSKSTEIAERTVHKVPQFDASKVSETNASHVSSHSRETAQGERGEENQFMSAKERRRELNRLAREMELIFVDKLNM